MTQNIVDFPDRSITGEAAEWLIRLDRDDPPSAEELAALRDWLQRSQRHRNELSEMAALWGKMNILTELAVPLGKHETEPRGAGWSRLQLAGVWFAGIAAIVLLGVAVTQGPTSVPTPDEPMANGNGLYEAAIGQQESLQLADDSIVLLNTNSAVEVDYSDEFRDIRLLRGEAHFTVARNTERPFRVFAGNGRVQAVGTAFSVYLRDEGVDITVTEGKVALATLDHLTDNVTAQVTGPEATTTTEVVVPETLSAGQRVTLIPVAVETGFVARFGEVQNVDTEALQRQLSWRDGALLFAGEPLGDAIEEISRYTTASIAFSDPEIRQMPIGGRFPIGRTDILWETLEGSFGLRVTHIGPDSVLLSRADEEVPGTVRN